MYQHTQELGVISFGRLTAEIRVPRHNDVGTFFWHHVRQVAVESFWVLRIHVGTQAMTHYQTDVAKVGATEDAALIGEATEVNTQCQATTYIAHPRRHRLKCGSAPKGDTLQHLNDRVSEYQQICSDIGDHYPNMFVMKTGKQYITDMI